MKSFIGLIVVLLFTTVVFIDLYRQEIPED